MRTPKSHGLFVFVWVLFPALTGSMSFARGSKLPAESERPDFARPANHYKVLKKFSQSSQMPQPGLLLRLAPDQAVRASASGKVVKIGKMRGYGRYILVDHGKGWISMYSNMRTVKVSVSDAVDHRSVLGTVKSGRLFFVVSYRGIPVNPAVVL